jgi:PiT family inorganic phosphate transporter
VPISSSQAVVGAIIGIGLFQGGRGMNFRLLGKIASGWVTAPLFACIFSFVSLFIIQNVFSQPVYRDVKYSITSNAAEKLTSEGITFSTMDDLVDLEFRNAAEFSSALKRYAPELDSRRIMRVVKLSEIRNFTVNDEIVSFEINQNVFTENQVKALHSINGKKYRHVWEFARDLASESEEWMLKPEIPENKPYNNYLRIRIDYLAGKFSGMR